MTVAGTLAYPEEEPGASPNEEGLHVLLVEDDAADAYLIKSALSAIPRVGTVTRVTDGLQALRAIEQDGIAPDLAIIDLKMPRMDGFRLLVELGVRQGLSFPKFVLTSSTARGDLIRSRLRGADRVLTKPENLKDLEVVLRHAVASVGSEEPA